MVMKSIEFETIMDAIAEDYPTLGNNPFYLEGLAKQISVSFDVTFDLNWDDMIPSIYNMLIPVYTLIELKRLEHTVNTWINSQNN